LVRQQENSRSLDFAIWRTVATAQFGELFDLRLCQFDSILWLGAGHLNSPPDFASRRLLVLGSQRFNPRRIYYSEYLDRFPYQCMEYPQNSNQERISDSVMVASAFLIAFTSVP